MVVVGKRIYSLSLSIVGNVHTNPSFLSQIKKGHYDHAGPLLTVCVYNTKQSTRERKILLKSFFSFWVIKGIIRETVWLCCHH